MLIILDHRYCLKYESLLSRNVAVNSIHENDGIYDCAFIVVTIIVILYRYLSKIG